MATNTVQEYKSEEDHVVKQEDHDEEHDLEEEEEEEALSLCDLPLTLINDKGQDKPRKQDTEFGETEETEQDEFDFNSWGGLLFSEEPAEMCAADEVFFQGQILPLRHSFSSDPSLSKIKESQKMQEQNGSSSSSNNKQFNRCESRSESMDNISSSNSSSRSCSLRSQNSSSSTSSTTPPKKVSKPKIRNQFHTIPSPKPQLRQTLFSFGNQGRKSSSSAWEFFRLGVAPAPEMLGLQDLKFRNSSSSSSNNSTSVKRLGSSNSNKNVVSKSSGGLLSGCGCSVDSVVAQLDTVMIKSTNTNTKTESVATSHAMKEKVVVAKLKEQNKKKHNHNHHNRQKHQAKNVMSRRRTFEWLKELHAIRHPEDEEALLYNT